jgi:uncharacterized protein (DUF1697 family)
MPNSYVALLRGINVGKAKRVAMSDLRRIVESLGYEDVKTLLNSGNIVFRGGARGDPAARIERALLERSGVAARVTVIGAKELARIIAANPLVHAINEPSRLLIAVLKDPVDAMLAAPLAGQDWRPEEMAIAGRAIYLWCPRGVIESRPMAAINELLCDRVTARNWATMTKLLARLGG